jgi:hypothetical protein
MILKCGVDEIECSRVEKGDDYITAYDESGNAIGCYANITDFSRFAVEGGDWSIPEPSPQEQTDALILDHEERLIYLELGVNE